MSKPISKRLIKQQAQLCKMFSPKSYYVPNLPIPTSGEILESVFAPLMTEIIHYADCTNQDPDFRPNQFFLPVSELLSYHGIKLEGKKQERRLEIMMMNGAFGALMFHPGEYNDELWMLVITCESVAPECFQMDIDLVDTNTMKSINIGLKPCEYPDASKIMQSFFESVKRCYEFERVVCKLLDED